MKLVINVDNYKIEACKRRKEEGQNAWYHDMILNGKPLEKEIAKELEKVKAEIKKIRSKQNCSCSDCLDIIDKHISELKGEYEPDDWDSLSNAERDH